MDTTIGKRIAKYRKGLGLTQDQLAEKIGITALEPSCNLHADCNFGQLSIRIPRCFQVCSASSTAFAGFEIRGQADPTPKGTIHLDADVSFGSIVVYYI